MYLKRVAKKGESPERTNQQKLTSPTKLSQKQKKTYSVHTQTTEMIDRLFAIIYGRKNRNSPGYTSIGDTHFLIFGVTG